MDHSDDNDITEQTFQERNNLNSTLRTYEGLVEDIYSFLVDNNFQDIMNDIINTIVRTNEKNQADPIEEITKMLAPQRKYISLEMYNFKVEVLKEKTKVLEKLKNDFDKASKKIQMMSINLGYLDIIDEYENFNSDGFRKDETSGLECVDNEPESIFEENLSSLREQNGVLKMNRTKTDENDKDPEKHIEVEDKQNSEEIYKVQKHNGDMIQTNESNVVKVLRADLMDIFLLSKNIVRKKNNLQI